MPVNSSAVSKLDKLLRSVSRRWLNASKQTVFKSLVLFAVRCSGFLGSSGSLLSQLLVQT